MESGAAKLLETMQARCPLVAILRGIEPGEVEEVFTVPFAHIADPANFRIEGRIWRGARRDYYIAPFGPYYIWGATARMLRALAGRLA